MILIYGSVVKVESTLRWEGEVSYLFTRTSLDQAKHWLDFKLRLRHKCATSIGRTTCMCSLTRAKAGRSSFWAPNFNAPMRRTNVVIRQVGLIVES